MVTMDSMHGAGVPRETVPVVVKITELWQSNQAIEISEKTRQS